MPRAVFDFEVVTPMFLSGPRPAAPAELRPPSIRGAMRFWFRAMMGAVLPSLSVDQVYALESRVFGNTRFGSSVKIRVARLDPWSAYGGCTPDSDCEGHMTFSPQEFPGVVYLCGQGLLRYSHGDGCFHPRRGYVEPASRFRLDLASPSQKVLDIATGCLQLMQWFGGLGARTRRGLGCVSCKAFRPPAGQPFGRWLDASLDGVRALFVAFAGEDGNANESGNAVLSRYSTLRPGFYKLAAFDLGPVGSWQQALDRLGCLLRLYRNDGDTLGDTTPDYRQTVAPFMDGKSHSIGRVYTLRNHVFGLPYQVSSGSRAAPNAPRPTAGVRWERNVGDAVERGDRRASPLWLRPVPTRDGWKAVVMVMRAKFLPAGATCFLKAIGRGWDPPWADGPPRPTDVMVSGIGVDQIKVVERFIDWLGGPGRLRAVGES